MANKNIFDSIISFFNPDPKDILVKLKDGLDNFLENDESVIFHIPVHRSDYKTKRWSDNNAFFNCALALTEKRLIILRSGSGFKVFQNIPINKITDHSFDITEKDKHKLNINSHSDEYIITVLNKQKEDFLKLKQLLNTLTTKVATQSDYIYCSNCGAEILSDSKFCSNCGEKVNI